ncbi:MAG: hypothetical protein ABSC73_05300 [Acidimicrobiales bacterium]
MGAPGRVGLWRTRAVERSLAGFASLFAAFVFAACGTTAPKTTTTTTTTIPLQSPAAAYVYMFPKRSHHLDHPYLEGKVVIVDKGAPEAGFYTGDFDQSLVRDLRSDGYGRILARVAYEHESLIQPNEVGTIIWIFCQNFDAGWSYTNGLEAYDTTCTGTVIDKAKNLVVGVTTSRTVPANRIMCPAVGTCEQVRRDGGVDYEYFARWIEHMPRK